MPEELKLWAVGLRDQSSKYDFGTVWDYGYNGQTVKARLDRHTWHFASDGSLMTGLCWKGITLYSPIPSGSSFAEGGATVAGDPLATPDPTIALFDPIETTSWPLVAFTAAALLLVIAGFVVVVQTRVNDA